MNECLNGQYDYFGYEYLAYKLDCVIWEMVVCFHKLYIYIRSIIFVNSDNLYLLNEIIATICLLKACNICKCGKDMNMYSRSSR
jgi:hypothetical protein